jgi:cytochrome c
MKRIAAGLGVTFIALMGWALKVGTVQAAGQDEASTPEFYTSNVQPIFQANCYRCHGGMNHRGGLNIQTRAGMLKGGHDGTVLVPGDPAKSLLVRLIRHEGPANDPMPMPPKLPKISDADIAIVERWVKAGAIMPEVAAKP